MGKKILTRGIYQRLKIWLDRWIALLIVGFGTGIIAVITSNKILALIGAGVMLSAMGLGCYIWIKKIIPLFEKE